MSSETRLFVGNLPENISDNALAAAFSGYGEVTKLELKSKAGENEQKKFAFVTLSGTHYNIESCIKHFSNETFHGRQLYVSRARESFLERLQREREQAQQKETNKTQVPEKLPKDIPVLKLSDKLNPRKRKVDTNTNDHLHYNSLEKIDNRVKFMPIQEKTKQKPLTEKDKKKQDSDKKRMESLKQKRQEFKQKQMIIKTGLGEVDKAKNKKIIFSENDEDAGTISNHNKGDLMKPVKKTVLFEDHDSDGEVNFDIKKQYEGKHGQKVLDLQSRYKSDKRFILDERFIEDEKEQSSGAEEDNEIEVEQTDEKVKQLNILQDVLGVTIKTHIRQPNDARDKKKSKLGMLRFDPTQPEHAKFLAPVDHNQETQKKSKNKKKKDKQVEETKPGIDEQEITKVEVSKEQFYKVSDTLKEAIAQPTTFSLRSLFSKIEDDNPEPAEQDSNYIPLEKTNKKVKNPLDPGEKNPFVYDSSESEDEGDTEAKPESTNLSTEVKTMWKENLFFTKLDNRLKEGLDFFNKPIENEQKERRQLKSLMKKRVYNKERKEQMFQKKIGGRKKMLKKAYRKKAKN